MSGEGPGSGVERDRLLIRAPNHLGDLVMALPALAARPDADVLVAAPLAPLVRMTARRGEVLPMPRDDVLGTAWSLRPRRYRRAVTLPPSFSSAAMLALAGIPERRGIAVHARRWLLSDPVSVDPASMHRASLFVLLVTGEAPAAPPPPSLVPTEEARARWRAVAGTRADGAIGVFPGSNAPSRRWPPERFAEVAAALAARGPVIVFGGPGERELTAGVAGTATLDLGGRTDLEILAAGLASLRVLVTTDSGPLHLAAALGTPTISLWGAGDPVVTGPLGGRHVMLRHPELPCVPCVKNVCPRRGPGYVLPRAEIECIQLIAPGDVLAAVAGGMLSPFPPDQ